MPRLAMAVICGLIAAASLCASVLAADPDVKAVRAVLPTDRGLVIHAGAAGPELAAALAAETPLVVHTLLGDAATEQAARAALVGAGLHGQATVARWRDPKSLPFLDNTAIAVIADLDAGDGLRAEECLRAVRPGGITFLKQGGTWSATTRKRPADTDDWPEYAHDAAASDVSSDVRVGPARGLQWQAGPEEVTKDGIRLVGGVWIACEVMRLPPPENERKRLIARDAYSGLPLWQREDVTVNSRFAFLADGKRVYVNPGAVDRGWPAPSMIALDLRTGRTVAEFDQGITFEAPAELPKDRKEQETIQRGLSGRAGNLVARLDAGVLLQVTGQQMVALDAESGKRLWDRQTSQAGGLNVNHVGHLLGRVWMHPLVRAGVVYVIEGESARSFSYTHWPAATCERIVAMDLATGKERWTRTWPAEHGPPGVAYNMTCGEGVLALAVRDGRGDRPDKGRLQLLLVDAATGRTIAYQGTGHTRGDIGGGHSHARAMIVGGKVWVSTIYGSASAALTDPANTVAGEYVGLRPVACTVWRATPKWLIGSMTVAALDGTGYYWTDAMRTHCDVGAFPANGFLYITPNFCGCQPYQPGSNATHSRLLSEDTGLARLERGEAKAAPAVEGAEADWPTLLRDSMRSAWSDHTLARELKAAWQETIPVASCADAMLQREWDDHYYTRGPITAASVAEGVCVVAVPHRQQVVALDATTGKPRWRIAVDGRVESQPTIHGGLVLFGTRSGWVYAVSRDTGATVWRYFAAPSAERIVVNGQLESPWPVFGSVVAAGDDVWAFAGRHSDLDGGLRWVRLDTASGAVRARGRLGSDDLWRDAKADRPTRIANMPPVYDGERFHFAQEFLERRGEGLVRFDAGLGRTGHDWDTWQARSRIDAMIPANTGTLQDGRRGRGLNANSHYYGGVRAKQFCYRGGDFVSLLGSLEKGNRGGNPAANILRMRRLRPDEKEPKRGVASVPVWQGERPNNWLGTNSFKACAVAGDRVLVAYSIEGRDGHHKVKHHHYLKVLDYETGKEVQQLELPAKALYAGVAVAARAVYVVSEDGTVTCYR